MFLFAYYRDYCHMNLALIVALAPTSLVTKQSQNNHQNKLGFNFKWKEQWHAIMVVCKFYQSWSFQVCFVELKI